MKKALCVAGLVAALSMGGIQSSFAESNAICQIFGIFCLGPSSPQPPGHHPAPAPEMGASALGLLMVGGLAFYVARRRPKAQS
jgi:hypothetical protein